MKPSIFIAGFFISSGVLIGICYLIFLRDLFDWASWMVVSFCIVGGFAIGFLIMPKNRLGSTLLAGWSGVVIGLCINMSVLYLIGSKALLLSVLIFFMLISLPLGWMYFNQSVIFSTSLVGSYLVMRGLGLYFGGFPNEFVLLSVIKTGSRDSIDPIFYGYLGGIIGMTAICVTM